MNIEQVVKEVVVRGSVQGMDQVARGYDSVADAGDRAAVVTEKMTKAQVSAEAAVEKLRLRFQDGYRQQQQYSDAQAVYQRAVEQGRVSQSTAAAELANIQNKLGQVSASQRAAAVVTNDLTSRVQASAGAFGTFGMAISALGPVGIGVAAVFGAVYLAINHMISEAARMGDKAVEMRSFAQTTGLAITELKVLGRSGAEVGVATDTIAGSVEKFTISLEDARKATGPLYEAVRAISGGLATELSLTKTSAQAWDVLAKARAAASDQSKNALSKAAFGKGGIDTGLVLDVTAEAGGIDALVAKQQQLNGQTDEQVKKWAATKIQLDEVQKRTANLMASTYTQAVLDRQLQAALLEERITRAIIAGTAERQKSVSGQYDAAGNYTGGPADEPIKPIDQARANLGQALSAGQKPDLTGYNDQVKAIGLVTDAEKKLADAQKAQADQTKAKQEAAIRDANLTKEQIGYLGSAATANERLALKLKELTAARLSNAVSEDTYNRAVAAAKLDTQIANISAHNSALGAAASVTDILQAKTLELAKAQQQGAGLTKDQIANAKEVAAAQALGTYQIQSQIDAEKVSAATMFMGREAAISYAASQTIINKAIQDKKPLEEDEIRQLRAKSAEMAKLSVGNGNLSSVLQGTEQAATAFFDTLIQGMAKGADATQTLISALGTLGSSLTSIGTKSLGDNLKSVLSGNGLSDPTSLGIGAAGIGISIFSSLLGREQAERDKEQQAAVQAAADAAQRVQTYQARTLTALADTSSLIGQLANLDQAQHQEQLDEMRKGGQAMTDLIAAQEAERLALIQKSVKDSQAAYDALIQQSKSATQTAIKNLTDATSNLAAALTALGHGIADLSGGTAAAVAKLQADFAQALLQKVNSAAGKDYLSTIGALVSQQQQDLKDAATLGINTSLVNQAFFAQAQKVIDDAGLTGAAFSQILQVFPSLIGNAHAFTGATQASVAALNDFIVKMEDFRKSLLVNDQLSTLSPAQRYAEAQAQFRDTLAKANTGDAAAQGNLQNAITTYLNQSKAFNASNTQYASDFAEVQAAISGSELAAQTQINYAAQQLQQLIDLNKNVINLASSIASPAASTTAASGVNAAAAAAAAAIEAAKTWHYPVLNPYYSGPATSNGGWNATDYGRYQAAHPEARYALGGLVTNGIWNQDSLTAQIAGGEFMTRAPSVNAQTLPVLQHINVTGSVPGNDNGALDRLARAFRDVSRNDTDRIIEVLYQVISELEAAPAKNRDAARQLAHQAKSRATS